MKRGTRSLTFYSIGKQLKMTPQSVYNYVRGKGGDGYVIDALIEEFNKLP
jgi:predicted transcriptional regulator